MENGLGSLDKQGGGGKVGSFLLSFLLLILVALFLGMWSGTVAAQTPPGFTDYTCEHITLRVANAGTELDGEICVDIASELLNAVQEAALYFSQFVDTTRPAIIQVGFADIDANGYAYGNTAYSPTWNIVMINSTVNWDALAHPAVHPTGSPFTSRSAIYKTMVHELCHSFGISGLPNTDGYITIATAPTAVAVNHGRNIRLQVRQNGTIDSGHLAIGNGIIDVSSWSGDRTFMSELELAILKDRNLIDTSLNLKNHFGYSEYRDGQDFTLDGSNNTFVANGVLFDSNAQLGIGLHIAGEYEYLNPGAATPTLSPVNEFGNTITLDADIFARGYGGTGIRIENNLNTITIAEDRTVSADGEYGIGVLTTRGTGTALINQGAITATDATGRGVWFNANTTSFDNSGEIEGGEAAIYISSGVNIGAINFMQGTDITGNISSNSNITTALTFGKRANANGTALNVGDDDDFEIFITGNISGTGTGNTGRFTLETWGGTTIIAGTINAISGIVGQSTEDSTLVLSGDTTFTGTAANNMQVLSGGTLVAGDDITLTANTVQIQSGGMLSFDNDATGFTTLAIAGNLNMQGGSVLQVGVGGLFSDTIIVSQTATIGAITIDLLSLSSSGDYEIITAASLSQTGTITFTGFPTIGRVTADATAEVQNNGLWVNVSYTSLGDGNLFLTWTATPGNNTWDSILENWDDDDTGDSVAFMDGDVVTFDASGTYNITLSAPVIVADMIVEGEGNWTFNGNITGGTDSDDTTLDPTLDGITGGLTKTGTGSLTLNGTNIFEGNIELNGGITTVSSGSSLTSTDGDVSVAGTLAGSGTVAAANVNVGVTGRLSPGDSTGAAGMLSIIGSLDMATGSTLIIDLASATSYDRVAVTGDVTANTITINLSNLLDGTYALITSTGTLTNTGTTQVLHDGDTIPATGRMVTTPTIQVVTDNTLQLTLASTLTNTLLTWTGDSGTDTWNTTLENWTGTVGSDNVTVFAPGDAVLFDDNSGGSITLQESGVTVADMTVGGTGNWTFSGGNITGSTTGTNYAGATGGLTKTGTGSLTLNGTNIFEGSIELNGGITTISSGSSLTTSSNVSVAGTLAGGGTVAATGVNVGATGTLSPGDSIGAIGTLLINGNLNMATGSILRVDIGANNASDLVSVSGTATLDTAIIINLSSVIVSDNPYTFITAGILDYTAEATVLLNGSPITNTGRAVITTGIAQVNNDLQLTLTSDSFNDDLTWTGDEGDNLWNLTSENWDHSSGLFLDGDAVTFNLSSNHVIEINGTGKTVADMTVTGDGNWTFIGNITGDGDTTTLIGRSGALTKEGTGTLILDGDNEFKGNATVTAGTLQVGNGGTRGTMANNIVVAASANVTFDRSDDYIYSYVIDGAGSVTKDGVGTLVLTRDNTYTGGTTVTAGTLQIGNSGNTGSITGNIINNAEVVFRRSDEYTYGGVISGTGNVIHEGAGVLTLSGNNTYTGATTITGSRSLVVTGTLGYDTVSGDYAGNITNNGTLTFNQSVNQTLSGEISGSGSLTKNGSDVLTLTGENTHSGVTTVSGGTLQIGNDGTTGRVTGNITNNANVTFNRSNEYIYGGAISGTGTVTQTGSGTLILTGTNNYTGGTTVSSGTLQIGNDGTTGSITGNITNNANVTFNRSNLYTYVGNISGTGSVTQTGSGTLILTGAHAHDGGTTVNAGILQIGATANDNASIAGNVIVESDAALAGYGTVGGNLTFDNNAIFRVETAENAVSNITVGGIVTTIGETIFDLVHWNDGVYTILTAGTFATDAFGDYDATLDGGALSSRQDVTAEVVGANLILTLATINLDLTWSDDPANNIWSTAPDANWGGVSGDKYSFETGDSVIFDTVGQHPIVVHNDGVTANNMTIESGTWNFTGGVIGVTGTLNVENGAVLGLHVNSAARLTAGNVNFNTSGRLNITGYTPDETNSDYPTHLIPVLTSGTEIIGTPILNVANQPNADFLTANARLGNNGRAIVVETLLTWNHTEVGKAHGTFTIDGAGNTFTLGANLADNTESTTWEPGWDGNSLTKAGTGALILTGNNEYTGSTTINGGALVIEGTLGYDNDNVYAGGITNNASLTFRQTAAQTLSGIITGTGSLTKEGTGTLTLTGANTYTGITTVNDGALLVGTLATAGTARIAGAVDVKTGGTLGGYGTIGSNVEVEDGAWLVGNLTIDGTLMLNSGATLSPGNSTGTITVNRDVTFREGSRYVYEIDKDNNAHDLLVVTSGNTITIEENAELEIIFISGAGGKNEQYRVIDAEPSQFVFSHAEEDLFVLIGDWTDMFNQRILDDGYYILWSVVAPEFAENISAYGTPNAIRVAAGMDELVELTLEEGKTVQELRNENALFDTLAGMPGNDPQALANAFAMLHGEVFAINQEAAARLQRQFLRNVPSADQRLWCLQSCVGGYHRWATLTGDWLGRKNLEGYSGYDLRTAGIAFGLDRQITRTSMFGFAVGYDKTNMDLRTLRSQDEMEAFRMALYGGWWSQNTYVDAYAGYTKNWHKTRRDINIDTFNGVARSKYSDDMFSTGFEAGHKFATSKYGFITPSVGLHYIHLSAPGITETGAGDADLHIQSNRYSSLRMPAGIRWSQNYMGPHGLVWTPELRTYYVREIADDSASVRTSFHRVPNVHFIADSRPWGRESLQVGTGLTARLSERLHIRFDYDREIFTRNLTIDQFAASLNYAW